MDSGPPLIFPVKVAVLAVLVIETVPVFVNEPMLCVAVPVIITPPEPLVVPPLLIKLPFNVNEKVLIANVAPLFIVNAAVEFRTSLLFIVTVPIFPMIIPPDALKGEIHSEPAVLADVVLY